MKRIWKYTLSHDSVENIKMPVGARILTADFLTRHICIWVLFDDDHIEMETRQVEIVGTGNDNTLSDKSLYISTVQIPPYVFHVFDNGVVE